MARQIKRKTTIAKRKAKPAKARAKRSAARPARKAPAKTPAQARASLAPIISREIIEEILVHSAKSPEGEQLSDQALSQIAIAASLDPARLLEAHARLRDEAGDADFTTVFRVVELWNPFA